ncbi:AAA family ATPase [Salsipaludibacter albus]|uniref:AAA family ATPase n=1 Tax=Salsipaludibacter albus TaxID=2849650 RepID=UPI001EE4E525|nr:MoxR family ATPase [Salsipaludibacter albus]MBY5164195.1 MoxR family ATPase [Salsipaludibacter albus]
MQDPRTQEPHPTADVGTDRDPGVGDPRAALDRVRSQVGRVVVGQSHVVSGLVTALLANGHVLLEGVPGVAKTLTVKVLAAALDLDTRRVQFTPDLMPSDVTGHLVLDGSDLRYREGPVFTNLLLADEINRTPPKTQAALLEAMEEHQVTAEGEPRALPEPFMVIATQNPVEYEGTYPLPEAQLDRFLFKLEVGYPDLDQEVEVVGRHDEGMDPHDLSAIEGVASAADIAAARRAVRALRVAPEVRRYVVQVVRATRDLPAVSLGVSPRGAAMLLQAAKAWAWLSGSGFVSPDHVQAIARPTLRHRIQLRPEVALEGGSVDAALDRVLATVPVPR